MGTREDNIGEVTKQIKWDEKSDSFSGLFQGGRSNEQ
jgi:hypothetical protein